MQLVLGQIKKTFPWITEAIRYTDQVDYYSGKEMIVSINNYNIQQEKLAEEKRLTIIIRSGNEAGHGKDAADRETNLTKCIIANARNRGNNLYCAEDVVKECNRIGHKGRMYILMNFKVNSSQKNTSSAALKKAKTSMLHTWMQKLENGCNTGMLLNEHYNIANEAEFLSNENLQMKANLFDFSAKCYKELDGQMVLTTFKERSARMHAKLQKRNIRQQQQQRKTSKLEITRQIASIKFGMKNYRTNSKPSYVLRSASPIVPTKKLFDVLHEEINSWHVAVNETDPLPPISNGELKVRVRENYINGDDSLLTKEMFSFISKEDKLIKVYREDDVTKIDPDYPKVAVFKRAPPQVLKQGFARVENALTVTTPPTNDHKEFLQKLYDAKEKYSPDKMHALLKIEFKHPKDHLTVEQIKNQLKGFAKKRKERN